MGFIEINESDYNDIEEKFKHLFEFILLLFINSFPWRIRHASVAQH